MNKKTEFMPSFLFSAGNGESLVRPQDFCSYMQQKGLLDGVKIPSRIIVCFHHEVLAYVKEKYQAVSPKGYWHDRLFIPSNREDIAILANFGIGGPITVTLVEELIHLGAKEFIGLGTAGTLQSEMNIGDIVLCTEAIRSEGTSYHYLPPEKYVTAATALVEQIQGKLKATDLNCKLGTSWTTDAPYRETREIASAFREEGVLTVEMEAASVYALAKYRNVHAAFVFIVSDQLLDTGWECALRDSDTIGTLHKVISALLA